MAIDEKENDVYIYIIQSWNPQTLVLGQLVKKKMMYTYIYREREIIGFQAINSNT